MLTVIPALLSDSPTVIQSQLDRIARETTLKRVQVDIVDPNFADEITISPIDLLERNLHEFAIDIHLMTNDTITDVVECSQVKGVATIIAQIEHMVDQRAFLEHVHSYTVRAGLALDLNTPLEAIDAESWKHVDTLQIMGIQAGAQGRPFGGERVYKKVRTLRAMYPSLEVLVDGGVTPANVQTLHEAGASGVVVGSFLWESKDLSGAVAELSIGA